MLTMQVLNTVCGFYVLPQLDGKSRTSRRGAALEAVSQLTMPLRESDFCVWGTSQSGVWKPWRSRLISAITLLSTVMMEISHIRDILQVIQHWMECSGYRSDPICIKKRRIQYEILPLKSLRLVPLVDLPLPLPTECAIRRHYTFSSTSLIDPLSVSFCRTDALPPEAAASA